jgi:hypothetical protein
MFLDVRAAGFRASRTGSPNGADPATHGAVTPSVAAPSVTSARLLRIRADPTGILRPRHSHRETRPEPRAAQASIYFLAIRCRSSQSEIAASVPGASSSFGNA